MVISKNNGLELENNTPVKFTKNSKEINGHMTDIVINIFEDVIFVIVSQLEKMGSMVVVNKQQNVANFEREALYNTRTELHMMGTNLRRHIESLYCKADRSREVNFKSMLFALTLRDPITPPALAEIRQQISEAYDFSKPPFQ